MVLEMAFRSAKAFFLLVLSKVYGKAESADECWDRKSKKQQNWIVGMGSQEDEKKGNCKAGRSNEREEQE
ncbi:unnamed protein product [Albugo candida]|uniref:Secreted protein n=1 Tax=Albugo candida TaxID=65357 RepID=A0A024GAV3_9STRA|nr:unnamed protein product [Albugo candida]|eukprot:CCI43442.1 unnamed protein product [Albugo candida]